MSLKEKMASMKAAKEQKFADRQVASAGKTIAAVAASIKADRSPIDAELLGKAAEVISEAQRGESEVLDRLLDSTANRLMYAAVQEHLSGDWMKSFRSLLAAVPGAYHKQVQILSEKQWREFGIKAGLDEKGLLQALQVIVIFRKSIDRNKLSKPKRR